MRKIYILSTVFAIGVGQVLERTYGPFILQFFIAYSAFILLLSCLSLFLATVIESERFEKRIFLVALAMRKNIGFWFIVFLHSVVSFIVSEAIRILGNL